jgi:polyisoprenoid-binding protein YceI
LKTRLDEERYLALIDVLTPESFEEEHLPGARNACVYQVDFLERIRETAGGPERAVVVYGSSRRNLASTVAAEKLGAAGYAKVFNFIGGIEEWRAAGQAVEGAGKAVSASPVLPPDGTYRIDAGKSLVEWTGRNIASAHRGTIRVSGGEIRAAHGRFREGEVALDMNSIADTDIENPAMRQMLEAHLKSDDFFDTARYPVAKFLLRELTPIPGSTPGMPNYSVRGMLTMKGTENPVEFLAAIGTNENEVVAQADFDMDRTKWNVLYGSGKFFERLGKHLVNDLISIQLRIVAA